MGKEGEKMPYLQSNEPYQRVDNTDSSLMAGTMLGAGAGLGAGIGGISASNKMRKRNINKYRSGVRENRAKLNNNLSSAEEGFRNQARSNVELRNQHGEYVQNRMNVDPLGKQSADWQNRLNQASSDFEQHGNQVREANNARNQFNDPETRRAERQKRVGNRMARSPGRKGAIMAAGAGIGALTGLGTAASME